MKCSEQIASRQMGGRFTHPCPYTATVGGKCGRHSPEAKAARERKTRNRFLAKQVTGDLMTNTAKLARRRAHAKLDEWIDQQAERIAAGADYSDSEDAELSVAQAVDTAAHAVARERTDR